MSKIFEESDIFNVQGFVGIYLHRGDAEFVPFNDGDPKHGFYRIPKEAIVSEYRLKNLIVNRASVLIAKRMRPGTSWGAGITHLEVGTGVGSGTTQSPQPEQKGQTALRTPLERKAISSWTYLDSNGDPSVSDTNILQLTTTFAEEEANGAIVESGLFGGDATLTLGSGFMFNYKVFPVINKDNTMQMTFVWKLTF